VTKRDGDEDGGNVVFAHYLRYPEDYFRGTS
jgi:hypothetical protein